MDISTIGITVLFIVLLMSFYWLYRFVIRKMDAPLDKKHLAAETNVDDIDNKGSVLHYSFWLYVNSWTNGDKVILRKLGDSTSAPSVCRLYMDRTRPDLLCQIDVGGGQIQTATLHKSFPLQTWTHVVVGFDGAVMDYYANGKNY
jgi:hypothetical protein